MFPHSGVRYFHKYWLVVSWVLQLVISFYLFFLHRNGRLVHSWPLLNRSSESFHSHWQDMADDAAHLPHLAGGVGGRRGVQWRAVEVYLQHPPAWVQQRLLRHLCSCVPLALLGLSDCSRLHTFDFLHRLCLAKDHQEWKARGEEGGRGSQDPHTAQRGEGSGGRERGNAGGG